MGLRRMLLVASLATILSLAWAGTAAGAFYFVTLSVDGAPVGADVSIRIDSSANIGGARRTQLYLIPSSTYAEHPLCGDIAGAVPVGQLVRHAGNVKYDGTAYAGYIALGTFHVPDVPLGQYIIAEDDSFDSPGCFRYTTFDVTFGVPDSAMTEPQLPAVPAGSALVVTAAILLALRMSRSPRSARGREKI